MLMLKAAVFLLLLQAIIATWPWSSDPPIASKNCLYLLQLGLDQKEKTWFLPRLITHLYQYHPPGNDSSVPIWPKDDKHGDWREMMPSEREYYKLNQKQLDTDPKWEEILATDWEYSKDANGERFRRHQMDNPNLRKVEYPGDEICSQPGDTKIVQLLTEPGLPFEVPCYSCSSHVNLSLSFHYLPKRDFYYPRSSSFADRLDTFPVTSFDPDMTYQVSLLPALFHSVHHLLTDTPDSSVTAQSVTRNLGGRVWWDRNSYLEGTGRLQIVPSELFYRNIDKKLLNGPQGPKAKEKIRKIQEIQAVKYGATYQCVQSEDQTTDVVVNVDSLVFNEDSVYPLPVTYGQVYEPWNSQWDLSNLTFDQENLKITLEWDPWSCCSACCCSVQMCGSLATERKCNLIYSTKIRKGYLSLKKIRLDLPVNFGASFTADIYATELDHLERIFDVAPYNYKGIPLYSSIIPISLRAKIHDDPQKLDCSLLAACRGMTEYAEKKKDIIRQKEQEIDPCQGLPLKRILLTKNLTKLHLEAGQSYRLMVDEAIYVVGKRVRWQIQRKRVERYDYTKDCDQQGRAVHPNGIHLLMTNLKEAELTTTILAALDTGERLYVKTEDGQEDGIHGHDIMMIAIWGGVILGFILLLIGFVWYMHKLRLIRIGSQLREADMVRTEIETSKSGDSTKPSTNEK